AYTFTGTPGQRIYFDAQGPYIYGLNAVLSDPNGNQFFNNNASYDEGVFTLALGGTYTLEVYSYVTSRAAGGYSFILDDVTTSPPALPLSPGSGAVVAGTLAAGGSVDFYRIDGTAGQRFYFEGQADSPSQTARYNVYDEAGNNVLNNWVEYDSTLT